MNTDPIYTFMRRFYFISMLSALIHLPALAQQAVYLDPSQPLDARVSDLIGRMTLEEKTQQMLMSTPAIPRLNIPEYDWWNESLHGVARSGIATIFPQAIGLGATFDEDLLFRVSSAISDEARAMYHAAADKGYHRRYSGLTFWTPNVNIFRDPRWGRGQETYGEDPYLTSRLGVAFVNGLQGDDPNYLKTAACAKHFVVHSGPEKLRHEFNAVASLKDMRETYFPAFKALVTEADVESVMCAYNATNGEPCCSSNFLLQEVLREEWKFDGHILSDCWALVDLYAENGHQVVESPEEAAALAVKRGVNLNCGDTYQHLVKAVNEGLLDEATIDQSLATLLKTRFRLGMFDPQEANPYNDIPADVINSEAHRVLAREAAQKSVVMLKNNGVLPLRNDLSKYYVLGPTAANIDALLGNYYGVNPEMVTFMEGIAGAIAPGSQLQYEPAFLLDRENINPIDWTTSDAQASDVSIVVMGITSLLEGEEGASIASPYYGDRLDYNLPQNQINYLRNLREGNDKPIIAIITAGCPVNLAEVHELADAVLLAWYPGQEGGNAVADIIFGKTSPSGRLPLTFPKSLDQLPPYEDYSMKGRTYRYMSEEPLYPFGFGLSYTTFAYSQPELSASRIRRNESLDVKTTVTNTGEREAEEVVQLYISDVEASLDVPLYSLKAFKRVNLAPGESEEVSFTITPEMMQIVNEEGESIIEKGDFKIYLGSGTPNPRSQALGASKPVEAVFTVR
ncbi:MAG: glycoside hydrolase family 3 C-terminal domain-containing protein [Cyclobacteriaceae bacterium]